MNKTFLVILFLAIVFVPFLVVAQDGIVPCGQNNPSECTPDMVETMVGKIYDIVVNQIATPLATLAVLIGAILMMTSAGNPNQMSIGKKIFWSAIVGLVLVFGSYLIIKTVLNAAGFNF